MAGRTTRSDSTMAMDALKELFQDTLLPDRKLKTLEQMEPVYLDAMAFSCHLRSPKGLKKATYTEICVVSFFEDSLSPCAVSWGLQDYLKTAYASFVQARTRAPSRILWCQIVAATGHNNVVFIKNRAVRTAHELLQLDTLLPGALEGGFRSAKPEQEKALLGILINKLGDSSSKAARMQHSIEVNEFLLGPRSHPTWASV